MTDEMEKAFEKAIEEAEARTGDALVRMQLEGWDAVGDLIEASFDAGVLKGLLQMSLKRGPRMEGEGE